MPEDMPDRMSEDIPDRMPEDMPDRMPEGMPNRMPDKISDRLPQDMPDRIPEDLPDNMPEDMPDRMPEDMPEDSDWWLAIYVMLTRGRKLEHLTLLGFTDQVEELLRRGPPPNLRQLTDKLEAKAALTFERLQSWPAYDGQ